MSLDLSLGLDLASWSSIGARYLLLFEVALSPSFFSRFFISLLLDVIFGS